MCSEWGDKTQIAGIALAANYDTLAVIIGGILGFILCVAVALLLGQFV